MSKYSIIYLCANTMNFNIRHMKQNYSALLNELQVKKRTTNGELAFSLSESVIEARDCLTNKSTELVKNKNNQILKPWISIRIHYTITLWHGLPMEGLPTQYICSYLWHQGCNNLKEIYQHLNPVASEKLSLTGWWITNPFYGSPGAVKHVFLFSFCLGKCFIFM